MIKLYDYQLEAVDKLKNGSILCGGVGNRWLEAETVINTDPDFTKNIDISYYDSLINDTIEAIQEYTIDPYAFANGEDAIIYVLNAHTFAIVKKVYLPSITY